MHPQLEMIDQLIRIFGWPALLGTLVWVIRKWDAGQRELKEMGENTKHTVESIAAVKADVTTIRDNHLAHLQDGISQVAVSNDKAVVVLQKIDAGIQILIDRTPRV